MVATVTFLSLFNITSPYRSPSHAVFFAPLWENSGWQPSSIDTYLARTTQTVRLNALWQLAEWPALSIDTYLHNFGTSLPIIRTQSQTILGGHLIWDADDDGFRLPPKEGEAESQERQEVVTYQVAEGDSISTIAERFGVTQETILWANDITNPDMIKPGEKLEVLPVSGVKYEVESGDNLEDIAKRHKVEPEAIVGYAWNQISDPDLVGEGQELIIPGGEKPRRVAVASSRGAAPSGGANLAAGGSLQWPTYGPILQYYRPGHRALDISPPYGTPVYAAEAGRVITASQLSWGLGFHIVIDHGNGFRSTYAHLSQFAVERGQIVQRGQMIGRVGSTGWSTGPHVHFVLKYNGTAVNPLNYLPH
jgi:murein DD-endopeptidase MepM/ murein hydrolase activator NlpD